MDKLKYKLEVNRNEKELEITRAYCIGYTGRNKEKTMEHIKELAEIGIPEPKEIPMLYPVRTSSLNQVHRIEVLGNETSGEAEIVLVFGNSEDEVYVTVGSDHTDRALEETDINKSKQVCDKPFAKKAWLLKDVIDHWDFLELYSEVYIDGEWKEYQRDKISMILSFEEIKGYLNKKDVPLNNSIFFSGTVPLLDGFHYGTKFRMIFKDPIRNQEIVSGYDINNIERW
ncbi:DUF2848 family protein [Oceanobacillus damuensis]|uniref:DUF2848 family protein n=1 Tax=Oceanobacillus damuensis TaxID=937928 RepID=UPI00082B34FA|nr:DUF2848 family protein [Oceanobacillus damuensis]